MNQVNTKYMSTQDAIGAISFNEKMQKLIKKGHIEKAKYQIRNCVYGFYVSPDVFAIAFKEPNK